MGREAERRHNLEKQGSSRVSRARPEVPPALPISQSPPPMGACHTSGWNPEKDSRASQRGRLHCTSSSSARLQPRLWSITKG